MRVINTQAVKVAASDLKPHPKNPRRGSETAIQRSIAENGWYGSLLVQEGTNYILAGWHRFLAGQSLGIAAFPVIYVQCDAETALRILLADNRTANIAGYDGHELLSVLEQIQDSYGAQELAGTGYDGDDVAKMVKELRPEDREAGSYEAGSRSRVGEYLFDLSKHEFESLLEDLQYAAGFNKHKINAEIARRLELEICRSKP